MLLSLSRYHCWWTISHRGIIRSVVSVTITVDTAGGELLVPEGIVRLEVSVSITESIPQLVNY